MTRPRPDLAIDGANTAQDARELMVERWLREEREDELAPPAWLLVADSSVGPARVSQRGCAPVSTPADTDGGPAGDLVRESAVCSFALAVLRHKQENGTVRHREGKR